VDYQFLLGAQRLGGHSTDGVDSPARQAHFGFCRHIARLSPFMACMKREMEPIMVNARNEDDEGNVDTGRKRKTSDHGVVASVVDKGKQMLEDATGKGKGKYETISMEEIGDSSHS
jgi:hypothetical protein